MGCGGGRRNTPGPGGGAPGAGGRAISLPWSQVRVLIAPSGSARMRRVRAPAPGRALPARGEGPPGRAAGGALDQGRPSRWPRFLLMIRPRPPPPVPRSSIVRAPARSTACPRPGGSQPAGWVSASARPAAGGSTIPCSTRFFIGMACGSTCTVVSWLIARPSAAGEPAHGAPPRCTPRP